MTNFTLLLHTPVPDAIRREIPDMEICFVSPLDAYQWLSSRWVDGWQMSATWEGEVITGDELARCVEWYRKIIATEVDKDRIVPAF
jgi:hypothetical protein